MPFIFKVPPPPVRDITNITYDGISGSFNPPQTNLFDFFFKPDGTKVYALSGNTGNALVSQHTLSTPWNISTQTYDSIQLSVEADEKWATGMFMKPDGSKLYVTGNFSDAIRQYNLPTPWDLTGATLQTGFWAGGQDNAPYRVAFKPDGTKMYVFGGSNYKIFQYSLSIPWQASAASVTYDNVSQSFPAGEAPRGMVFSSDGTKLHCNFGSSNVTRQYTLNTPWDINSLSLDVTKSLLGTYGIRFGANDTKLYVGNAGPDLIYQYTL